MNNNHIYNKKMYDYCLDTIINSIKNNLYYFTIYITIYITLFKKKITVIYYKL